VASFLIRSVDRCNVCFQPLNELNDLFGPRIVVKHIQACPYEHAVHLVCMKYFELKTHLETGWRLTCPGCKLEIEPSPGEDPKSISYPDLLVRAQHVGQSIALRRGDEMAYCFSLATQARQQGHLDEAAQYSKKGAELMGSGEFL
jgi:hypothetical protein